MLYQEYYICKAVITKVITNVRSSRNAVLDVMNHYGLNKSTFADALGVSQPVITHLTTGRNKPSLELVMKLQQRYPELSLDWLLTGQGAMLRKDERTIPQEDLAKLEELLAMSNQLSEQWKAFLALTTEAKSSCRAPEIGIS